MKLLEIRNLSKTFVLHQQQTQLNVLKNINFSVEERQCVVLHGHSGAGKSTLLRLIYGNYLATSGQINILHEGRTLDICSCEVHKIIDVRRSTLAYVSQYLRVIPRVNCLDVVMEPALARGMTKPEAAERAKQLLTRLNIPERLWQLAPGTFSGGEQQRINIARSFIVHWPLMLLDEPTASLDEANKEIVISMITEARSAGSAVVAIFHDAEVRERLADDYFDMNTLELTRNAD